MVILTATCRNGIIETEQPLPSELEGKQIQIKIEEIKPAQKERRRAGSLAGKIWMSPDFDEPLEDFSEYI